MKMDARMPAQPCLDFRRLMSGIVIENHVDAQAHCDPALQLGHELEKLIVAMPRQAIVFNVPCRHATE